MPPDRHATKPKAVRMPDGLEARVKEAAQVGGETINGFIVAAILERLERRGSTPQAGTTTRVAPRTRKRADTVPPVVLREPKNAAKKKCHHRVPVGAYCRSCDKIKEG